MYIPIKVTLIDLVSVTTSLVHGILVLILVICKLLLSELVVDFFESVTQTFTAKSPA